MPVLILLGIFVCIVSLMWWSWRRHVTRDSVVQAPLEKSESPIAHGPYTGTYVCTTHAGEPLARIHAHTLGERARATVLVAENGDIVINRQAARTVVIPARALRNIHGGSGMAGKFMGGTGVLVLTWKSNEHMLDTGVRFDSARSHDELLTTLSTRLEEAS